MINQAPELSESLRSFDHYLFEFIPCCCASLSQ